MKWGKKLINIGFTSQANVSSMTDSIYSYTLQLLETPETMKWMIVEMLTSYKTDHICPIRF